MTLHVRWFRNVLLNDKKCQNLTRKSFPTNVKCDVDQKKKKLNSYYKWIWTQWTHYR